MFVFQDAPLLALELPGLTLQPLIVDSGIAKFDLTLWRIPSRARLPRVQHRFVRHRHHYPDAGAQTLLEGIAAAQTSALRTCRC